jgi:hypothetical protein
MRWAYVASIISWFVAGCSVEGSAREAEPVGRVQLALTVTYTHTYSLDPAHVRFTGVTDPSFRRTVDVGGTDVYRTNLPVGEYDCELLPGFVVLKDGSPVSEPVVLETPNPVRFTIGAGKVTVVFFFFAIGSVVPDAGVFDATVSDASVPDASVPDASADPCLPIVGVTCSAFEQAYLKASNTDRQDYFGRSVAIDGDTLVVGAEYESSDATGVNGSQANNDASRSGAAYVFVRSGSMWTQQAYLKASNTEADDFFGSAVAISGDTIVVGAYGEDSGATGINGNQADNTRTNSGAAYVFTRSGTTWTQRAYLKASNRPTWFGRSLDISGDTIAVGAWREPSAASGVNGNQADTSLSGAGAVYVFTRTGTVWSQQAYIKASNPGLNDEFSRALALDGDTLVVGAPSESSDADGINGNQADDSATFAGAVYVFTRTGGAWSQQAYVKASNSDAFDYFGEALDVSGDTIVVGARGEASPAAGVGADQTMNMTANTGAVYVFTRSGSVWSQQEYIKAAVVSGGMYFGAAVALEGATLVVGAPREGGNGINLAGDPTSGGAIFSGAGYLFARAGTSWTQRAYIKASNTGPSDGFGSAVALSAGTFVVVAENEASSVSGINGDQTDNGAAQSGAAYVRTFIP